MGGQGGGVGVCGVNNGMDIERVEELSFFFFFEGFWCEGYLRRIEFDEEGWVWSELGAVGTLRAATKRNR